MENQFSKKYTNLSALLKGYRKHGKCLAAFNVNDNYDLKAAVDAANQQDTHLMVMTYPPVAELVGVEVFAAMVEGVRKKAKHNVYLHLDHSTSIELCKAAVDAGYDSVMFDGSHLPLEQNIASTKEVVAYAHKKGVVVEAEIGKILGREVVVKSDDDFLASVEQVARLNEEAKPDLIAVGIGTAHGFTPEVPKINFKRLSEIAAVVETPLVLHGGTGIPDEDIQKAISMGICKINIGTVVHTTYMKYMGEGIQAAGKSAYPPFIMKEVLPKIQAVIEDRLRVVNSAEISG
ncbi:class II fructose-bisphosphate aldolase [Persicobacter psychrovividus]|uniref:Fructose-bisphosphate aldolase n=1 Tax=Persicobacter psychrovividus TaxID=387638 RepID=A0ABM7VMS3_9BACT|nr:fructose-bisphosphate aldolase [Persicobacter psychrovividus]